MTRRTRVYSLPCDTATHDLVKALAEKEDRTMSSVLRRALALYAERGEN